MDKQPAVYILASKRKGILYTGVTSSLVGRIRQHREHVIDGFTKRYDVRRLAWYQLTEAMDSAILREKEMESRVEDPSDRRNESRLERPLARNHRAR